MSAETQSNDDAQTQTEPTVSKTVTIIAYGRNPSATNRMFAQALDQTTDYAAEEVRQTDTFELVYEGRWEDEVTTSVKESAFKALVGDDFEEPEGEEDLSYEVAINDAIARRETTFESQKKNHTRKAAKAVRNNIVSAHLPDELTGGLTVSWNSRYQTEEGVSKVRVNSRGIERGKVLAHQSERDGMGEMYEGDEEYPSAKFEISLEGTEDEVETWSEEVVAPFMEKLTRQDGVGKVRLTDCKEKVEKEGDCFTSL